MGPGDGGVIVSGEAQALWFGDSRIELVVQESTSAGTFTLAEYLSPMESASALCSADHEQTYIVREGELALHLDGEWVTLSAGQSAHLPRGTRFASRVLSPTARFDVIAVPAGLERFLRAAGEPADGPGAPPPDHPQPDQDVFASAAALGGIEFHGPAPAWGGDTED